MTFQKCKYVALCEEVILRPESQPAVRSHPEPSSPCVHIPSNHVPEHATPINTINLRGAGATTPTNVNPQAPLNSTFKCPGTTTPVHVSGATTPTDVIPQAPLNSTFQGPGTTTPVHVGGATTPTNVNPQAPLNSTLQGAGTTTPVHVSAQGAGFAAVVKVSPQQPRSKDALPTCKCTAGKCKVLKVDGEECYVCPIPKVMFPMVNSVCFLVSLQML